MEDAQHQRGPLGAVTASWTHKRKKCVDQYNIQEGEAIQRMAFDTYYGAYSIFEYLGISLHDV